MATKATTPATPTAQSTEIPSPPVEVNGIDRSEDELILTYQNEAGSTVVRRVIKNTGEEITSRDEEYIYNYTDEEWELTHSPPAYKHNLADDGETLIGDGSNWDGVGHEWKSWFIKRHFYRLTLRFPHDKHPKDRLKNV